VRCSGTRFERERERSLGLAELEDTQLTEEQLWVWYFSTRLGVSVPEPLDGYAQRHHMKRERLCRAVIREYCFTRLSPGPG